MEQSEEWFTGHRYLNIQFLENMPEFTTTISALDVMTSNAALAYKDILG
jgi:hypothetical protein